MTTMRTYYYGFRTDGATDNLIIRSRSGGALLAGARDELTIRAASMEDARKRVLSQPKQYLNDAQDLEVATAIA